MSSGTSVGVSIAAGLILAIIIGSSLVYYSNSTLPTASTPSAISTTSTKSTTSSVSIVSSSTSTTTNQSKMSNASSDLMLESGLVLKLATSTTRIASGQSVKVSVELFNPKSTPVNVTASKGWPGNAWLFMPTGVSCGTQNYPIGMGIFQGYYTLANISSASKYPLVRVSGSTPASVSCPAKYVIDYYWFEPMSDSALLAPNDVTLGIHGTYALFGYTVIYTDEVPTRTASYSFLPGAYTVVAATEWGDMTILHLVVL